MPFSRPPSSSSTCRTSCDASDRDVRMQRMRSSAAPAELRLAEGKDKTLTQLPDWSDCSLTGRAIYGPFFFSNTNFIDVLCLVVLHLLCKSTMPPKRKLKRHLDCNETPETPRTTLTRPTHILHMK